MSLPVHESGIPSSGKLSLVAAIAFNPMRNGTRRVSHRTEATGRSAGSHTSSREDWALDAENALTGIRSSGFGRTFRIAARRSVAVLDQNSDPRRYENPTYGMRLLIPSTWDIEPLDKESLVTVRKNEVCQVTLLAYGASPFHRLITARQTLTREVLQRNPNFRKLGDRSTNLGNLNGLEAEFVAEVDGNEVTQRYLIARRHLIGYSLITSMASMFQQECEPDVRWIRENISIAK